MSDGPTLYAELRSRAIDGAEAFLREMQDEATEGASRQMARHYREVLERVYADGVRDGFHEGLAAAASVNSTGEDE